MAIAAVGTPVSAYASSVTKTVAAGSLVVFCASCLPGNVVPFTAPTKTGTCTIGTIVEVINVGFTSSGKTGVGIWWMPVTGSGSLTLAINIVAGGSDVGGSIHEYSGADVSAPIDASNSTAGTGLTMTCALTGVLAGSVVVMIGAQESESTTYTATAPYTRRTQEGTHVHCTCDYIVPSNGNYTPTVVDDTADHFWVNWQTGAAAFLAAAAVATFMFKPEESTLLRM